MSKEESNPASSGHAGPASSGPEGGAGLPDGLASLARDIDSLMSAPKPGPAPTGGGGGGDSDTDQVDLLLKEINELLTHDTNALLSSTNNMLGKALETIFDPQALAKKNEKIDKALVQALAKGRGAAAPAAPQKAPVTSPAPKYSGVSRPTTTTEVSTANLRPPPAQKPTAPTPSSRAPVARPEDEIVPTLTIEAKPEDDTVPTLTIEEKPEDDTVPTLTIEETPAQPESKLTVDPPPHAEPAPAPAPEPVAEQPKAAPKPPEKPKAEAPPPKPEPQTVPPDDGTPPWILRILAIPMRFVPESAKLVVSAVALTMLFSMPVAWVLAHRAATHSGVGPVDFTIQGAMEEVEQAEKAHAEAEAKKAAADEEAKDASGKSSAKSGEKANAKAKPDHGDGSDHASHGASSTTH